MPKRKEKTIDVTIAWDEAVLEIPVKVGGFTIGTHCIPVSQLAPKAPVVLAVKAAQEAAAAKA